MFLYIFAQKRIKNIFLNIYFICKDPQRKNAYLVMCEVLSSDGTPHPTNGRATIEDVDNDFWFGFEQEYFLWNSAADPYKVAARIIKTVKTAKV